MCGIAGFIYRPGFIPTHEDLSGFILEMTNTLVHRGPDDSGLWSDPAVGIALGHRRLSIIDLSPQGRQPMQSSDGRYVMVFNGEIYNYLEIRKNLESRRLAPAWRGHSDTEVMLAAISAWGIESAIGLFHGMFAFALWDRKERALYLARDRVGKKPLYYGWTGNVFLFGSELKALRKHPVWDCTLSREAVCQYLHYQYIPAPLCIYEGIFKLVPGSLLKIGQEYLAKRELPGPVTYWSFPEVVDSGSKKPFEGTIDEATDELETILKDAVCQRLRSDVPTGVLLSGGVDSSLVTAFMQTQTHPVHSYSIGFNESSYDESEHACKIAGYLGTSHTELSVKYSDALNLLPQLPILYDEPFGDSSELPTHLVCLLAKQRVTVALTGDGGDESFGGYSRYFHFQKVWKQLSLLPFGSCNIARHVVSRLWCLLAPGGRVLPNAIREAAGAGLLNKLSILHAYLHSGDPMSLYKFINSCAVCGWGNPSEAVKHYRKDFVVPEKSNWDQPIRMGMFWDTLTYLPDDILTKTDRASMGVSLELRSPLLDHRVIEFAWRLPLEFMIQGQEGKLILKRLLARYVPKRLFDRPKMGFAVPVREWLRGPLREWAHSLLSEPILVEMGFIDGAKLRGLWSEHVKGVSDMSTVIWTILMFELWAKTALPAVTTCEL